MSNAQANPTQAPPAHIVFAQFRDILADLYPDIDTAKVVVDDIGLATANIDFSPTARTNWHHILKAIMRAKQMDALIDRVQQDHPTYPPLLDAVQAYHDYLAHSRGQFTVPAEPPLDGPTPRRKNNPWMGGSFYLLLFVVVMATLVIAASYVDWYVLPALLIAALLAVPLIGVLQSFNDGTLSEQGFLQVVMESYRRLPLLRRGGS